MYGAFCACTLKPLTLTADLIAASFHCITQKSSKQISVTCIILLVNIVSYLFSELKTGAMRIV